MQRSLTIGHQRWTAQFRSDGRKCALLSSSGIELYTFERPIQREFAEDLGPRLRHAAFSPDGRWLAASSGQYLGVWDLTTNGPGALAPDAHDGLPAFSEDGKELFASGIANKCSRWRLVPATISESAPTLQPIQVPTPNGA